MSFWLSLFVSFPFHRLPFHDLSTSSLSSHLPLCLLPPTFSSRLTSLHFILFSSALLFFYFSFFFTVPTFNILSPLPCHLSMLPLRPSLLKICFPLHCSSLSSSPHVFSLLFTPSTPSLNVGMHSLFMIFYLPSCMTYSLSYIFPLPSFSFFLHQLLPLIFFFASLFQHAYFPSLLPSSSSHLPHLSLCYSTSQHWLDIEVNPR